MATRTRVQWRKDARGNFTRQIGWILTSSGKRSQPKFNLGSDKELAIQREKRLRDLWNEVIESSDSSDPNWPDDLLKIAKAVASGTEGIVISRLPDEPEAKYARRFNDVCQQYPGSLFLPGDRIAFEIGSAALAVLTEQPHNPEQPLCDIFGNDVRPDSSSPSQTEPDKPLPIHRSGLSTGEINRKTLELEDPTLHEAFSKFQEYLNEEFFRPETGMLTGWGNTQVRQVETLRQHLADRPLGELDENGIIKLFDYWRRRPFKLGTRQPVTAKSATNYIKALKRFFKWLDRAPMYAWKKPFAFNDLETRVQRLQSDRERKRLEQVDIFSLDELKLLMRYGSLPSRI